MSDLRTAARKAREWTIKRDVLIREEHESGRSLRSIAEEVQLSHSAIAKIVHRFDI